MAQKFSGSRDQPVSSHEGWDSILGARKGIQNAAASSLLSSNDIKF
jgi:hypothetical protein